MQYFISDHHFGHNRILAEDFDNRPFDNLDNMREELIRNHNSVVKKTDDVYILGDMFGRMREEDALNILSRLNGNLHYIKGNHDLIFKKSNKIRNMFKSISDYAELKIAVSENQVYTVVLSHYPIPSYHRNLNDYSIHFYGHVHNTPEETLTELYQKMSFYNNNKPCNHLMLNVGCMKNYMQYTPQTFKKLLNIAIKKKKWLENKSVEDLIQQVQKSIQKGKHTDETKYWI